MTIPTQFPRVVSPVLPSLIFAVMAVSAGSPLLAQQSTGQAVVQPLPSPQTQRLNRALHELAKRPQSVAAMLEAGNASLEAGDLDGALGFFGKAADREPNNPAAQIGLGKVYLRAGRPLNAIPAFNSAQSLGAPARDILSELALAFDLIGDQPSAQAAYFRAIELNPQDDEARRRLAISQAISGNKIGFESTLRPLLEARNPAAYRARVFGLAILEEQEEASRIVSQSLSRSLSTRLNPYLAYMPRLTPAQQAAAANLGIFPKAANIGRDDPRLARFASEGTAGSRLEPAGAPLGERVVVSSEVAQPVIQDISEASQEQAEPPASTSQPVAPPSTQAQPAPTPATVPSTPAPATPVPEPVTPPASVADAFADLGDAAASVGASASGAVDLATIDIPRELEEVEPEKPAPPLHPRRIWVQLATGRDVDALGFDWRRFTRRAGDLLEGYRPHVTPWGQANRLLAGPFASQSEARKMVNDLGGKGIETFTYTSPEGTEIQELK